MHTPPPVVASYVVKPYEEPPPSAPNLKMPGFFCRWFKSCVERKEAGNIRATVSFEAARERWELARDAFDAQELKEVDFIQRVIAGDVDAVETYFEAEIQEVIWPRETLITYDVRPDGTFLLNVNLPEIEDMPTKTASAPARGFKLSVKDMGSTWVQKLYMRHIHGIGFRLVGEAFASSHAIKTVVLSAYSQRASKVTGAVSDEYLYSVRVPRLQWSLIEFHQLHHIDVVEALAAFEMRRDMTRTAIFRPIIPITV